MGIVEDYEHAIAEPPRRQPVGYWIGWAVIVACLILVAAAAFLNV